MKIFLFIFCLLTSGMLYAQSAEDSVKTTVNSLFAAMKAADAESIRACFADSAVLQTIAKNKEGNFSVKNESVAAFAKSIGRLPKDSADERITFDVVKLDGPLAIVWTPYRFYYAGKFSHCGVNSFQLVWQPNGWKIQYLIDTRRRMDCE